MALPCTSRATRPIKNTILYREVQGRICLCPVSILHRTRSATILSVVLDGSSRLGQLHALMTQDEIYGDLLTRFFELNDYPDLAWMHHIACKRYGQAASALIAVDSRSTELEQKQVSFVPLLAPKLIASSSAVLESWRLWQISSLEAIHLKTRNGSMVRTISASKDSDS